MAFTDPIGDMFSRIRNGQMRSLNSIEIPSSNFRKNILKILKNEGYIKDYYIGKTENNKTSLTISLKYYEGDPVIKEIKRISKPGRRVYSRATSIPKVMNGLGLAILSTPRPKAKPLKLLESILQFSRTIGLTMPHPKISSHLLSLESISTSADGSVNGKYEGLNLNFTSLPNKLTCWP